MLLQGAPQLAQLLRLRLQNVREVVGAATLTAVGLHRSLDSFLQLSEFHDLACTFGSDLLELSLQKQSLFGEVRLTHLSQALFGC